MIYYTETARESAKENIDKCINSICQVPGNVLDSLIVTKTVGHLYDLKKYIEKESKDCKRNPYVAENAIREEEGLKPLNQLTADNVLDDTYSAVRDYINTTTREGGFDPASLMVVKGITQIIVNTIKEKNYVL